MLAERANLGITTAFGLVAIALLLLEGVAWAVAWMLDHVVGMPIPDPTKFLAKQSWQLDRFANHPERRDQIHPILGWGCRAGFESPSDHLNMRALRAKREYDTAPPAGVRRIAAFGDSFVYCNEVVDDDTWPAQIEAAWRAEVLNYGSGGYGADQALMRFRHEGVQLHPDAVIIGCTSMMAARMVSRYRRFQDPHDGPWFKPRFVLHGDELRPLPAPITSRADAERLRANPEGVVAFGEGDDWYVPGVFESRLYRWSQTYRLVYYSWMRMRRGLDGRRRILRGGTLNRESEAFRLYVRVVEEFAADIRSAGAVPLALMIPARGDVEMYKRLGHTSYDTLRVSLEEAGLQVIDAAVVLAASSTPLPELFREGGHCSREGNALVAKVVAEALTLTPQS